MAHRSDLDLVKEATSTTGTGTLTLAGAASGYVGVCDAANGLLADGDTGWFVARNDTQWELFLGTRGGSGTTLARTTRLKSSTGGAVDFTAPPVVYGVIPGAALVGPAGPAVKADRGTSDQTITTTTWTKVQLNSESFDLGGCFDSTTNYRWTPNVPGYYQMSSAVNISAASSLALVISAIYKNGTANLYGTLMVTPSTSELLTTGCGLVYMNGTTDYLELWALASGTTPKVKFGAATYLTGFLARPA